MSTDRARRANRMKIAVDAMGADLGPSAVVEGALEAVRDLELEVVLVGDERTLEDCLRVAGRSERLSVVHAEDVVAMDEAPASALRRKRGSSMRVAVDLVSRGEADAVLSPGNTGAFMAMSAHVLRRLDGVDRPAIMTLFPTVAGRPAIVLDAGANVDCRPAQLRGFALMGAVYARVALGREQPTVALLSNGAEPSKGNEVTRETDRMLRETDLDYRGYVEGRDLFTGDVDVIVCDGFVGNTTLKACEGLADAVRTLLERALDESLQLKIGLAIARAPLKRLVASFDYREHGGAPLLGVDGVCVVAHGSSGPREIRNAIRVAATAAEARMNEHIRTAFAHLSAAAEPDRRVV